MKHNTLLRKKTVAIRAIIAILLALCGFACIPVGGILEESGYGRYWWPLMGLTGFFVLDILALVLLFSIYGSAMEYETEKKKSSVSRYDMAELRGLDGDTVLEKLKSAGFQPTEDGYYRKKMLTFSKDFICYLVRLVNAADVRQTIASELQRADTRKQERCSTCLILLLYSDAISPDDVAHIREISSNLILRETIVPARVFNTCILIPVNTRSGDGQFLHMKGFSISVYKHGCNMVRRRFGS